CYDGHSPPGRAVLEADRPGRLHVFPQSAGVEPAEVVADDEEEVDRPALLERPVDGLHDLPVFVAGELPGSLEPENALLHVAERLDHPAGNGATAAGRPGTAKLVEGAHHPDRLGGALGKSASRVEMTAGRVGEQAHVRTVRRSVADLAEEIRQNRAPQAAPLVLRQDGHVDDVEVPAAIADDPAHRDATTVYFVDDMTCSPTPGDRGLRLFLGLGREPRSQTKLEIVDRLRTTVLQGVAGRERRVCNFTHHPPSVLGPTRAHQRSAVER